MSLTKQQWLEVEQSLSHPYGRVRLNADGHLLTLSVEKGKGLRYLVAVYIDGVIDWKLCNDNEAELPRKFWKLERRYLYPAAHRAECAKLAKKRGMPADIRDIYTRQSTACSEMHSPCWPNAKDLCRHLRKTCTSIELLPAFDAPTTAEPVQP